MRRAPLVVGNMFSYLRWWDLGLFRSFQLTSSVLIVLQSS